MLKREVGGKEPEADVQVQSDRIIESHHVRNRKVFIE